MSVNSFLLLYIYLGIVVRHLCFDWLNSHFRSKISKQGGCNKNVLVYISKKKKKVAGEGGHHTFTRSNSTKETVEKGVKYVQSLQKRQQKDAIDVACVFMFNFEQISHLVLVFPLLNLNK